MDTKICSIFSIHSCSGGKKHFLNIESLTAGVTLVGILTILLFISNNNVISIFMLAITSAILRVVRAKLPIL